TGHADAAAGLVAGLHARLDAVRRTVTGRPRPRALVLEWTDPPFAPGHWVPEMVTLAGGEPALGRVGEKSTRVDWRQCAHSEPDLVVCAPCGYDLPGSRKLAEELLGAGVLPAEVPVWAVDANASFARPGPRLVDGVEALAGILHPDVAPVSPIAERLR
ncbi:MAG TPA: cobalamin-binding protein, partial [Marmoricola sp.]|nr:cobalamin-binding protein [Marmoricola sp.]